MKERQNRESRQNIRKRQKDIKRERKKHKNEQQ